MSVNQRCDGTRIKGLPSFRIINPFVMKGRTESSIYFSHEIRLKKTLTFLHTYNAENGGKSRLTLFHILICGLVRTLALRPQLNRFVSGNLIYQRKKIQASFIVKKRLSEDGEETNAKISFSPDENLESVIDKVNTEVRKAREASGNESDREIDFFTKLPRFALNLFIRIFKLLDYYGVAPKSMIDLDPLYTSVYIANLGSVGIDAPFHHLYEWGNASVFAAIGKMRKGIVVGEKGEPEVEDVITINYTLDDRITEGIYCARAIELFKNFAENPEVLLGKPDISPELIRELALTPEQ